MNDTVTVNEHLMGMLKRDNIPVYYYEGKPYRVLHEGKFKATSMIQKVMTIMTGEPISVSSKQLGDSHFEQANNGSKWLDCVIYEPLYEECDIRICVKEKQDFYNNYKTQ